ncbi:NAD(P)-binding protein [Exidia glandulosa HHB12029]|uniref:NAD(P)-binding protein n=1 Tax=Exidia glandulosa HHB12029 TaxID=1314781 RepID=A0A165KR08_EXIGL|nr:NAD(P)-binding protein [Exidia glandulosa HHB12029]
MSTNAKKVVVVFGATGAQGGSVAKYLLEDGTFGVRGVTRNADSPSAQGTSFPRAEVVVGDLNKPETLAACLAGAYGVFGVTDFWALVQTTGGDMAKTQALEVAQGKALVDAAKAAGVKHFVCAFYPEHPTVYSLAALVDDYLKSSNIPRTSLYTSGYMENLVNLISGRQMCTVQSDGSLVVDLKMPAGCAIPLYSVDQTGGWAIEALKNPDKWIGKDMHMIGEHVALEKVAEVFTKLSGRKTVVKTVTLEEFAETGKSDNPFVKEAFLNLKYVRSFHETRAV